MRPKAKRSPRTATFTGVSGGRQATLGRIDPRGDMLVFLSGEREIHEARDFLQRSRFAPYRSVAACMHACPRPSSSACFTRGRSARIILTTNVAETSLTVPRIKFVIDSGLARVSRYAHRSRIQRLPIEADFPGQRRTAQGPLRTAGARNLHPPVQ